MTTEAGKSPARKRGKWKKAVAAVQRIRFGRVVLGLAGLATFAHVIYHIVTKVDDNTVLVASISAVSMAMRGILGTVIGNGEKED